MRIWTGLGGRNISPISLIDSLEGIVTKFYASPVPKEKILWWDTHFHPFEKVSKKPIKKHITFCLKIFVKHGIDLETILTWKDLLQLCLGFNTCFNSPN